jgi:hypothetical protein
MSNQRAGKTHKAAANDGLQDMKIRNFFKTCVRVLEDEPDSQFYFEQVVDHINQGGSIMTDDLVAVRRILGV